MSAPPHQVSNESLREVPPNITSSSTANTSIERHSRNNPPRRSGQANVPRISRFEGRCDELKTHVYDAIDIHQADQYIKTTREICDYIGRTYKYGMDIRLSIENMELYTIPQPADPPENATRTEIRIWEKSVDDYVTRKSVLSENVKKTYSLIWGQCSDVMRQKAEAHPGFNDVARSGDALGLLQILKNICYHYQVQKHIPHALHEAKRRFYNCHQLRNQSLQAYFEYFQNQVDVIIHIGGEIGLDPAMIKKWAEELNKQTHEMTDSDKQKVMDEYLAIAFLNGSDRSRFGSLIDRLQNDYLQGHNGYPRTLTMAYHLLTNWKPESTPVDNSQTAVFVTTQGSSTRRRQQYNPSANNTITCYNCGLTGHYANNCPHPRARENNNAPYGHNTNEGNVLVTSATLEVDQSEFTFHMQHSINNDTKKPTDKSSNHIPMDWILLDNQSTIDIFTNSSLLKNIRESPTPLKILSTGGITYTNLIGDLPGYGQVWYHPQGIANILSLSNLIKKGYKITYSSSDSNTFDVTKHDGTVKVFKQSDSGLFFLDTKQYVGTTLVNTVNDNQYKYSKKTYSQAELARKLQRIIGRPSTQEYIQILANNLLPNCPVTTDDVTAATNIFGPDIGSLKGKTVRKTQKAIIESITPIPIDIYNKYKMVTLCIDVMYVNNIPFLTSISRHLRFGTVEWLKDLKKNTIVTEIKRLTNIYKERNFTVKLILADGQFENISNDVLGLGISMNITGRDEHVPEVERYIRTLKERIRGVYNTLPFKTMPRNMMVELVKYANFWLNSFPKTDGISKTLSPRTIVTGRSVNYSKHCKLEFGEYCQTHEQHNNSMAPRTIGAIALRPTGNLQGTYLFMSLDTGRIIARNNWNVIPMSNEVITRIQQLANPQHMSTYLDEEEEPISISIHNGNIDEDEAPDDEEPLANDHRSDSEEDIENTDESVDNNDDISLPGSISYQSDGETAEQELVLEEGDYNGSDLSSSDDDIATSSDDIETQDVNNISNINSQMDALYGPRTSAYDLRPRKARDYGHLHLTSDNVCMTQYSLKKGLELFGKEGSLAVEAELRQLHDRKVILPIKRDSLSVHEREMALPYLMFLKQKRSGQVKGRGCADGRRQRIYSVKGEVSSPTVATESVLLTCTIDAFEGRDIATVDIPGTFLQADMEGIVHVRLTDIVVDAVEKIDPIYGSFSTYEGSKKVLYVQLQKALYGTLQAPILFWKKLSSQLQEWGFSINPYDTCVANKIIDGHQCTIVWHVDDLKISHVESSVVSDVISQLETVFGREAPLTITRGKYHEYLGMHMDFSEKGKVTVKMEKFITDLISQVPADMSGLANTPAASHLMQVNLDNPVLLDETTADLFHTLVAKLLYLSKHGRPDIMLAVSFLCTRVKAPDEDDYRKLTRVIKYLRKSINLSLTLECNNPLNVEWWVDASYACHWNMRSQSGGLATLGKGAFYTTSIKQKLNTRSSTEAELVAVHDVIPHILWTRNFLLNQGSDILNNTLYQDNRSAIFLETNGSLSSSKRTRHIDVRYFFVKDKVDKEELKLVHCKTDQMLADFFTKPLQGNLFVRCRNLIMNNKDQVPTMATAEVQAHQLYRSVLE